VTLDRYGLRHAGSVLIILGFFVGHWVLSVFMQTFYLHRYAAHRMFKLSPTWDRIFHFLTFLFQGSSYLHPAGYAMLHREHHAFSDTERDPHSPHTSKGFLDMNIKTALRYVGLRTGRIKTEPRFEGGVPSWPTLERIGDFWLTRLAFGAGYTLFYIAFAPHWAYFLLLPAHYLMGPLHGAIVNWGGHMYGYRNFDSEDKSRNTLIFDVLTLGELFQNNHHKYGQSLNFAVRWFEIDPSYWVIRVFNAIGIVHIEKEQRGHYPSRETKPVALIEPMGSDAE
jgi:stearoyl-CoA desaturase (Delta-9 desaturase)